MPSDEVSQLLQQGIAAAKAGQKAKARVLLTRVTELEPSQTAAWLWLSHVVQGLDARLECLQQAQALDPQNAKIQRALHVTHKSYAKQKTQAAVAAIERGELAKAEALLMQAVEHDEAHVAAWWGLSQVVEGTEDKEICFENVLALDPDHAQAQAALAALQRDQSPADVVYEYDGAESAGVTEDVYVPVDAVPDAPMITASGEGPSPPDASAMLLEDELLCPYCAASTVYEDRRCPVCAHKLWIKERAVTQLTTSYFLVIALEIIFALGSLLLPLLLLVYVNFQLETYTVQQLFRIYWGTLSLPPGETATIFSLVSPVLFWLALLPLGLAGLMIGCVLSRWQPLFYVVLLLQGVRLLGGMSGVFLSLFGGLGTLPASPDIPVGAMLADTGLRYLRYGIVVSEIAMIVLTGLSLSLLLKVMDHFVVESRRILLRLDRDLEPGDLTYLLRGRAYAKQGMWAAAALHLRRSLVFDQRVETFLHLALAYINLGYYDVAETALKDAERLNPDAPNIVSMAQLLAEKRQDVT